MGDGTLRQLFGGGTRPLAWALAGMAMIAAARLATIADQQGMGTTVSEGALILISALALLYMSFTSLGMYEPNGEKSLLSRSLGWGTASRRRRRDRAEADNTSVARPALKGSEDFLGG